MNLFYLDRKGPGKPGQTQSMIVRAKTEEKARNIAHEITGEDDWALAHKTLCLGVYYNGEEQILLRDVIK